ncbi:hypothetical protein ST27_10135 [Xanthomonas phaseoli pv. phaseoli]|uniref:hypothetical protein n=1 Tax=Xanthomonas phaseoli TaxID=1985254 RepID=UPI000595AAC2|nr:hypothetical protein [Xanthomonas phaseoli]KIJ00450.1 hypothetical protein ST27_10135 [Xanthomonas phaseoli pv. phaseoli]UZB30959.1 hypothetical protein OM951_11050 [Xanthomonas phaseoli pv. phaseoli]
MSRQSYRHTVKGFHNNVELSWCEGSRSWLLQIIVNRTCVIAVLAYRKQVIQFVEPEPDAPGSRHYVKVRGAFVDLPVESWRELKQWHDAIAKAVAPVQMLDDVPHHLPAISPPLAPYARRAHA